jgi:hypothetical protein
MNSITLEVYSEAAIAVFGETSPFKEDLGKIGGKFNPHLKGVSDGERRPGWIFSIKRKEEVKKFVDECNKRLETMSPVEKSDFKKTTKKSNVEPTLSHDLLSQFLMRLEVVEAELAFLKKKFDINDHEVQSAQHDRASVEPFTRGDPVIIPATSSRPKSVKAPPPIKFDESESEEEEKAPVKRLLRK